MRSPARSSDERERARALVRRFGWNPSAYQILNRGMSLWLSAADDAVAGYARFGSHWVVAGAPVCEEGHLGAVTAELVAAAAREGCQVLFFGAGSRLERLLAGNDTHHVLLLGALPVWDARVWDGVVRRRASLRAQIHRGANKGVVVREWATSLEPSQLDALRIVQREWLRTRGLPPLHFMTEWDMLDDLRDRRVFVATRRGVAIGYLLATPVPARHGWLIEQWPRVASAPNGTSQLLVDAAMRALGAEGFGFVTLGMAPLSDRAGPIGVGEPAWVRGLLTWLRAHGRRFYNFRGLDAFKAALAPDAWERVSLIVPGDRVRLRHLRAVAGVFGGGSPELLLARALVMAVRREVASLAKLSRARSQPLFGDDADHTDERRRDLRLDADVGEGAWAVLAGEREHCGHDLRPRGLKCRLASARGAQGGRRTAIRERPGEA